MKYTAHKHTDRLIKVETKDTVICSHVIDMDAAEMIADSLNNRDIYLAGSAKLSERKTVHEWLNSKGVPSEENGRPICLLRRLAIALEIHD